MRCCLLIIALLLLSCGSNTKGKESKQQQVYTKNIDLGMYVGSYEVTVILDGKEQDMYALYTSIENPHVYLTYRAWTARDFDPVLLRVEFQGDTPLSNWGKVYFKDPTNAYEAYIIW